MDFLIRVLFVDNINNADRFNIVEVYDFEDLTGETTLQPDSRYLMVRNAPHLNKQEAMVLRQPLKDLTNDPLQPFVEVKRSRYKINPTVQQLNDLTTKGWADVEWADLEIQDGAII